MPKRILLAAAIAAASLIGTGDVKADETEKVFKFYCAQCHGTGGKGDGPNVNEDFKVSPRNFTKAKEMNKLTDADLKNVILDGGPAVDKSPLMPPWGKTLSEKQVDGLVKHLRKLCNCKGKQG